MNVEIVSIGTEILLGEIVDTNSASLARQLRDIGANIYFMTTVGDNRARIADALRTALGRADVVITTGGLGPTVDDVTRQGVADATNRKLEFRPELLAEIAERFRLFGSKMSDNNRVQAYIPAGSIPVYNRLGTAPCFIVEAAAGTIISLPGVPREMRDILAATVIPYLRERMGGKGIIKARVLRTAGIGESSLDSQIGDLMTASNPTVGLAAHTGQTDIRITARADSEAEADTLIAEAEAAIRERVGEHIYGVGEEKLETVFARQLNERGFSLAVSYTGPPGRTIIERLREEGLTFRAVTETELGALLGARGRAHLRRGRGKARNGVRPAIERARVLTRGQLHGAAGPHDHRAVARGGADLPGGDRDGTGRAAGAAGSPGGYGPGRPGLPRIERGGSRPPPGGDRRGRGDRCRHARGRDRYRGPDAVWRAPPPLPLRRCRDGRADLGGDLGNRHGVALAAGGGIVRRHMIPGTKPARGASS